jgi:hypothetical protein
MVPAGWAAIVEYVDFDYGIIMVTYVPSLPVNLLIGPGADGNANHHINAWTSCGTPWSWGQHDACGQTVQRKKQALFAGWQIQCLVSAAPNPPAPPTSPGPYPYPVK